MNESLVPANTKRSTLILGMYRPLPDLAILVGGVAITVALLMVFNNAGTLIMILACLPMLIAVFLTLPLPNYHNVLCGIQSILAFYSGRRNFIWRGWCLKNEFKDDNK